jgi:hypothetical protein
MKNLTTLLLSTFFITTFGFGQPNTIWTKTFGSDSQDYFNYVSVTSDSGYIATGKYASNMWLLKTDASGNEEWQNINTPGMGWYCQQTSDGNYIMIGISEDRPRLIKIDSYGYEIWNTPLNTFGNATYAYSGEQTSDGGYIITGTSIVENNTYDVFLIKTDLNGNEEWGQTFGGSNYDKGYSVKQTTDGGYIIVGMTESFGEATDLYMIKTDSNGNQEWYRNYGGASHEIGWSIQQTPDEGYIIAGETTSYGAGERDAWLIKTNSAGIDEWSQTFGGSGHERAYSVQQTDDGGYIIAGVDNSFCNNCNDVWIVKTDDNGTEEWNYSIDGGGDEEARSIHQTSDGGFIISGSNNGATDGWLVRIGFPTDVNVEQALPLTFQLHNAFPNPFNPVTTLRYDLPEQANVNIIIYDMLGRQVRTLVNTTQDAGFKSVIWNATNDYGEPVSAGVYIYQIQAGEFVQTKKMVLLK